MIDYDSWDFTVRTPFSNIGAKTEDGVLVQLQLTDDALDIEPVSTSDRKIARQIERYCKDPAKGFDMDFELRGTDFQKRVWRAMQKIPPGSVRTYGELAKKLKTSARAVGGACRRNNIVLVVPCHRVVASDGLGGFSGERMGKWPQVKRMLLDHEGVEI